MAYESAVAIHIYHAIRATPPPYPRALKNKSIGRFGPILRATGEGYALADPHGGLGHGLGLDQMSNLFYMAHAQRVALQQRRAAR